MLERLRRAIGLIIGPIIGRAAGQRPAQALEIVERCRVLALELLRKIADLSMQAFERLVVRGRAGFPRGLRDVADGRPTPRRIPGRRS